MGCAGYGKWILHMIDKTKAEPIAFIDNNAIKLRKEFPNETFFGLPCIHPEELKQSDLKYDLIILSIPNYYNEMREQLISLGVSKDKIVGFNMAESFMYKDTRIAYATHCLSIIKERNILGDMAEVGVYRGEFSSHLNAFFPSKKLFLFDTFEGFPEKDIKNIKLWGEDFSKTSINQVMNNMPYKESCIVAKGYFPDSIPKNISQNFCFVSLDADLYEPIYNGLKYFWPKMSKGGYIFVHDYGTYGWPGVKKAVDQFCNENNISFVPIFDRALSIIFTKN